jgi:hypothetical protein
LPSRKRQKSTFGVSTALPVFLFRHAVEPRMITASPWATNSPTV